MKVTPSRLRPLVQPRARCAWRSDALQALCFHVYPSHWWRRRCRCDNGVGSAGVFGQHVGFGGRLRTWNDAVVTITPLRFERQTQLVALGDVSMKSMLPRVDGS